MMDIVVVSILCAVGMGIYSLVPITKVTNVSNKIIQLSLFVGTPVFVYVIYRLYLYITDVVTLNLAGGQPKNVLCNFRGIIKSAFCILGTFLIFCLPEVRQASYIVNTTFIGDFPLMLTSTYLSQWMASFGLIQRVILLSLFYGLPFKLLEIIA
jgi:hypothetical protein